MQLRRAWQGGVAALVPLPAALVVKAGRAAPPPLRAPARPGAGAVRATLPPVS
ncbi:MAG TPA: hypothetical protein VFA45_09525 [Actinomycetes bacterium]|nr:hypothetical protein [Actinomycetes bacterium]